MILGKQKLEGAVYMTTGKGESVPNTEAGIRTDTAFKLTLISKRAKEEPRTKFTSLMHLLNAEYLRGCYAELKRGKAAGIDGRTAESYTEAEITQAIDETILKLKKRTYRPQPVRRVYIEKANGQKRPLGIPTVMDKVIQRGVAKILETISKAGTPQGGIISPILANIYLHYVLDLWFEKVERKGLDGEAYLIRYADDFVICLQRKEEAQRVMEDVKKRMGKFGLELAEDKTRIVEFGRFAEDNHRRRGEGKPGTIDFLGFTHYCTRTRNGQFMVRVKTGRKKMSRAIKGMGVWLKSIRNLLKLGDIWKLLKLKLQGHYNYYGLSGNFERIQRYYRKVIGLVFKWMNRRSQKKSWNWELFWKYLGENPLPKPKLTYAIYNTW